MRGKGKIKRTGAIAGSRAVLGLVLLSLGPAALLLVSAGGCGHSGSHSTTSSAWELTFLPDSGIRMDSASLPKASVDASGAVYLFYHDRTVTPEVERVSRSDDGLNFPAGTIPSDYDHFPYRVLMPDGVWRMYGYDRQNAELKSWSSTDGVNFTPDADVRYRPHTSADPIADDNGTIGVYDIFTDSAGGVVFLYVGDMAGLNNVRRAYSPPGDNGWLFAFDRGDVLGDAGAGGGPNSFVDPKSIRLPDGRRRLFVMRQGQIYSFLSRDEGKSFSEEAGTRLQCSDFTEFIVYSLHDPMVIRLPDEQYRMYVAAKVSDGSGGYKFVVVSATTPRD
jgi:hypothetical protein